MSEAKPLVLDVDGTFLKTDLLFETFWAGLGRDPRATLLIESGEGYNDLKSVVLYCNVELLHGPEAVAEVMGIMQGTGARPGDFSSEMSEQARASYAKRVVMRFTPFGTLSWDHSKLGGRY